MSEIQLGLGKKILKNSFKDYGQINVSSMSQGRPVADASLALHIGPYGDVLRTSGRFLGRLQYVLGTYFAEWVTTGTTHNSCCFKLKCSIQILIMILTNRSWALANFRLCKKFLLLILSYFLTSHICNIPLT